MRSAFTANWRKRRRPCANAFVPLLITLMPSTPWASSCLQAQGRTEDAITTYRQALKLRARVSRKAWNSLATALQTKGDLDAAVGACRRAIAFRPDYTSAHTNLGGHGAYDYIQGHYAEALACFERAMGADPGDAVSHSNWLYNFHLLYP